MAKYKGYNLVKDGKEWNVYGEETSKDVYGRIKMVPKKLAGGYPNLLTAKKACDAHFGRL